MRRDARLIASHCLRRPRQRLPGTSGGTPEPATARQARAAVSSLITRLARRAKADFYEQYEWRGEIAAMADFLERRRCLRSWLPRIDRALRRLPLAEPPHEYEEEYAPEREDYGPYP